jgi:hypothetical protein
MRLRSRHVCRSGEIAQHLRLRRSGQRLEKSRADLDRLNPLLCLASAHLD